MNTKQASATVVAETFPEGNLDSWFFSLETYIPQAISTLRKTIVPVLEAALLELVGTTAQFSKKEGHLEWIFEDEEDMPPKGFRVTLQYQIPSFKVDVNSLAVAQDTQFILLYLRRLPQLKTLKDESVKVDTKTGIVQVKFALKTGALPQ